jgi:N-acetylglucosaminyldiphosphoundecaprenol N-acetyl-beta-D-mannosaminyltransferase
MPKTVTLPGRMDILGVPVSVTNTDDFLKTVQAWMVSRDTVTPGQYVCFRDVHGVVRAWDNASLMQAHHEAMIVAPDGLPLSWIGNWRGHKQMRQVCGPDTMLQLCIAGQEAGWRHALFGARPETLQNLEKALRVIAPDIQIVSSISPPFSDIRAPEMLEAVDQMRTSKPDLVWVGLGSPKQELWMMEHAASLPGALSLGVGAAFDMHAGEVNRAPQWVRNGGMEWAWRAASEPGRLGKRYGEAVPRFLGRLAAEEFSRLARGAKT